MYKIVALLLSLLLFGPPVVYATDPDTINTVPSANTSFLTDLQTFLREEDADRFAEQFSSFVVSGGTHSTVAGLVGTPASLIAYPNGGRITETGSITYPDNDTGWVIASRPTTGNLGTYTRVSGTHYLIDFASSSLPTLPTGTVQLMRVTTLGGAITAVADLRVLTPVSALLADFIQAGAGAVARTVQNKERDIVSVKDYGVVSGDSSTAVRTANVTALRKLISPTADGGDTPTRTGTVIFPGGETYYFNDVVTIRDGIHLDLNNSTIDFTKAAYDATENSSGFLYGVRDFSI